MNIALVRLSALGDIVNAAFVLQFVKKALPHARITWVCEKVFAPLFHNHPLIDNLVTPNLKALKKEKSLTTLLENIRYLKNAGEFDKVIDMQGLIKSALVSKLLSSNTHGFDAQSTREALAALFYKTTTNIPYETNVVLRNAKVVGDALGITITKEMILNKEAVFPISNERFEFYHDKPNVAFVVGASWESKKYPKEHLVKVIEALDIHAHIIWGNEAEKADAHFIASQTTKAALAPKMALFELVSFISKMDLVIGNDTGPTHIAWAQNIPSITLFGPTNERMIFETPKNIALHSPSKVDISKIDKNDFSIKEIPPQRIAASAKELLDGV